MQPLYPQQQPQQNQLQPQPQQQPQQQQWVAVGGDQQPQPQGQVPVQNHVVHVMITPEQQQQIQQQQQQQLQLQQRIQQLEQQLGQQQQPPQQSFQPATMTGQQLPLPQQQQQQPQVIYQQSQLSPQQPSTLLPSPIIPGVQQVQQGQGLPQQQQPVIQTIMLPQQQQLPQQILTPQQLPAPVSPQHLQQIPLAVFPTTGSNPNSAPGSLQGSLQGSLLAGGANGSLTLVAGGGAAPYTTTPPVTNGSLSSAGHSYNSNNLGGGPLSFGHQSGGPPRVGMGLAGGSGSGSGTQFIPPMPENSRNHLRGDFAAQISSLLATQQQEVKKPVSVYQPEEDLMPDPSDTGPKQLIVNYIPVEVDAKELYELFLKYGTLQCVKVMMNQQTGTSRGFGFIYFVNSVDAAEASKALHGFELHGKTLRVGYAVPQRPLNEGRANRPPNSGK